MTIKQERVQELIQERLSTLLLMEITDPALQDVTITDVRVDREIEYADIYVNALGDESREDEVMKGLERAKGFMRKHLAATLRLRRTPQLHFHWDHQLAAASHIEELLDSLKKERESQPPENKDE
ncbi:MAG: 30S ribosome-binding factor RbfA [Anaerolineae bacterium]|nr:30S ribosome-binding factor RbfA [Anaerolineae bacterium]